MGLYRSSVFTSCNINAFAITLGQDPWNSFANKYNLPKSIQTLNAFRPVVHENILKLFNR